MGLDRVGWRQRFLLAALLMAAVPSWAGPVDVEQGRLLAPAGAAAAEDDPAAKAADAAEESSGVRATGIGSGAATTAAMAQGAAAARDGASAAKPAEVDLRRTLRDATKPVLDDISHSAVAEAVRGLAGGSDAEPVNQTDDAEAAARRRSWDGQSSTQESDGVARRPRTDAELAADKAKASFLFQALLEEVAPWAIAAAVLYGLVQLVRFALAVRRRVKADQRERRQSRRSSHGSRRSSERSAGGTPTQH